MFHVEQTTVTLGQLLKQFTLNTGTQQRQVAEDLGFSPQRINNYYRDMADPPFEFYTKFKAAYKIDLRLQLEQGRKDNKNKAASFAPLPVFDLELKPLSKVDFFNDTELAAYYIDAPMFNDCAAFFSVPGGAMCPAFNKGEIIAVKRITNFETLPLGEAFFIITAEQILLRYIRASDNNKTFLLKAVAPGFDDMMLKRSDIKFLFQVRGKISKV